MAEIALTDEQRCKRTDGRKWRCRQQVVEGRGYCQAHLELQAIFSQNRKRQPVPESEGDSGVGVSDVLPRKRTAGEVSDGLRKRAKKDQIGATPAPVVKVGAPPVGTDLRRPIRSKNSEPIPIAVVKTLPNIKEYVKAAEKKEEMKKKKKIVRRCHWCLFPLSTFCVLVMCLTCKENFFCEECIDKRFHCKKAVQRKCPVCEGECPCKASACRNKKPKQVKTKENVTTVSIPVPEKMSDFEKSQQLHMIRELLPVMAKMNQEKIIELNTEAQNTGTCHDKLKVQIAGYTETKECRLCKACIPDVHRSCKYCSYLLCLACCHDIHDGSIHSKLQDSKKIRSKSSKNKSWRFNLGGRISCPPRNLGGCESGPLILRSFYPLALTKDLEESAKQLLCNVHLEKVNGLSGSSPCMLCDENGEMGLYFSTKQEFKDNNLEHFMKHWGEGKPMLIRDVFQTQPNLDWGFEFFLCEYLKKSKEMESPKNTCDFCEVEFREKQVFSGRITHENVKNESLKFKLRFSSEFLQYHLPEHHHAILQSLPIQEYMNPFTGFMNLGSYSPYLTKNPNLGSYVNISYGGLDDNVVHEELLSYLCFHPFDEVNILVRASNHPIRKKGVNELKSVMKKDNSHEGKIAKPSKVDDTTSRLQDTTNRELVVVSNELASESESESDDDDVSACGIQWDIFRREDVPLLSEFLRKYADMLKRPHGLSKKVVHPLFDEVFYLDAFHKMKLRQEFNVHALSFKQHTGEAVIIPAGCAYQMRKIKSCINVVYEFLSPESALESIKVSDELRLLPVKNIAIGNMVQVKNIAISRMQASTEAMREVFATQP